MRAIILIFLLFIANAQDQLQQEEAIQIVKDLKDATTKRLDLLEMAWKKYSTKKNDQICGFTEMVAEQEAQCQSRNSQNEFISESINQSTSTIETNKQKIDKNVQRRKSLEDLKCKSNVNNIKLLKDQKEAKTLSIQLQKSFAQSSGGSLLEMLQSNSLYEQLNLEVTEQEASVIKLIQEAYQDEKDATAVESTEFSQIQSHQQQLPYSSQKSMEKNRYLIITTSQEISEKIDKDQQSITLNSINSVNKIDQLCTQLQKENEILKKLIDIEGERKIDLDDQLTILNGENQECDNSRRKMEIIALLLQQDYDREQILYMKEKEAILKELDIYTDLLRYYLRQIYKTDN
ncbi:unnamed protein product (macronuclear) [Paramecium tetraurelia]|uniref:Uncharacterized protein n=1 Tax=Paramecium tetraurelia TaxID=5888 RepID=A0CU73_PARTE|nr:uncharacterized protein GSPATT00010539001 [Paramecium tetraurelia]CAK74340.1 unnamed protein product [Paramecium tetraurelia]|eukprot:XP_001441737.1 hypothetical protein (macronuclear) [Paramecium tetraurelia strain d4-2]